MADQKQISIPEFRAEAVRLAHTSGRSRREIAADLGIGLSTLRNWIDCLDARPPWHLRRYEGRV